MNKRYVVLEHGKLFNMWRDILTYARVNDMPFLHLGFSNGSVIRTRHFNHPGRSHHGHRVLCEVAKNFLFLAEDGDLLHMKTN